MTNTEYEQLLERIGVYQKNYEVAKERGDMKRAKKYQNYVVELNNKKIAMENAAPKEMMKHLNGVIANLKKENYDLKMSIREQHDIIDKLNRTITTIKNAGNEKIAEQKPAPKSQKKPCPFCDKEYVKKATLMRHIRDKHPDKKPDEETTE